MSKWKNMLALVLVFSFCAVNMPVTVLADENVQNEETGVEEEIEIPETDAVEEGGTDLNEESEDTFESDDTTGEEPENLEDTTEGSLQEATMFVSEEQDTEAEEALNETPELKENSWRYQDGERTFATPMERAGYANAWNKENGRYVNSRGEVIPGALKKGIDVSEHNGKIDWAAVKNAGIEFAILRCGYGNDEAYQDDDFWDYNVSECERLGIPYGVYIYSYATNTDMAYSEAQHALRLLKGCNPSYPVYFDMEDKSTQHVGNDMLGRIAQTFCDTVSAAGYRVGIYANLYWWNTFLTSGVFNNANWSKWIAQYNYQCEYKGTYDVWQCTETGKVNGITGNVDLNFWMTNTNDQLPVVVDDLNIINYTTHLQDFGWQRESANGYQSGVTGYSKRLEAIRINVGSGYGDLGVRYSTHVEDIGWQGYVVNGQVAGTEGQKKAIQAIKIELTGNSAAQYDIYYRVHSADYGWLDWASNGAAAGTEGYDKQMEAIQIAVLPKGSDAPGNTERPYLSNRIMYRTHASDYGWMGTQNEGDIAGTTGESKRLEAIEITTVNNQEIQYRVHVQDYGWQSWVNGGTIAGTTGESKRLEAIQIQLTGGLAQQYDIYYRVHAEDFGWLDWAKNGEAAGTEGFSKRLEAIQITYVEKGGQAPGPVQSPYKKAIIVYQTHVEDYGWQNAVSEWNIAGTEGEEKRMEAINIIAVDNQYQDEILYQTHVEDYGWQNWVTSGNVAGTYGESKRLEAIRIKLTGKLAEQYDIYYQVHSEDYGWLGWAKNGEAAGTEGLLKRMEAIQIVLVTKGGPVPGSTYQPFVKK